MLGPGEHGSYLAMMEGREEPLVNGYFATMLPNQADLDRGKSWEQARADEVSWFATTEPWCSLDPLIKKRLGTGSLTDTLSEKLCSYIESTCVERVSPPYQIIRLTFPPTKASGDPSSCRHRPRLHPLLPRLPSSRSFRRPYHRRTPPPRQAHARTREARFRPPGSPRSCRCEERERKGLQEQHREDPPNPRCARPRPDPRQYHISAVIRRAGGTGPGRLCPFEDESGGGPYAP